MSEPSDSPPGAVSANAEGALVRRRDRTPQVPIGLRPAPSDDELETNILERWQGLGVVLTIFLALFLPAYWLFFEQQRGSKAGVEQRIESIARGKSIFGPTLPNSPHGSFQANCAQCHGTNAEGSKGRTWIPPGGNKPVPYPVPELQTVFVRQIVAAKKAPKDAYNYIYDTLARGRAGTPMPAWGLGYGGPMNDQQIEDVINWLISIQPELPKGLELASGAHEGNFSRLLAFASEQQRNEEVNSVIVLSAPLTQLLAAEGGGAVIREGGKCNGRTCGGIAVFAVVLMFVLLAGGAFMLLQSSFGVLQGYLISGTAFWASWFVLALIWFTGVPGIPLSSLPGIRKDIPRSTPRYSGPQGTLPSWHPVSTADQARLAESDQFIPAAGTQNTKDQDAIKAAETAASETVREKYQKEIGTEAAQVTVPGTVLIDTQATQIVRSGGVKYVKFTTKPATPGATASEDERALITKVKPASFIFELDKGTEALQTLIALPLTFGLTVLHLFGLMWYERRHRPVPVTTRTREPATASV